MQRIWTILLPMATVVAMGQQPWTYGQGQVDKDVLFTDIAWSDDSVVVGCYRATPLVSFPFGASILVLNTSGNLLHERQLAPSLHHAVPTVVLAGSTQGVRVLGSYAEYGDSLPGFFHYKFTPDNPLPDSTFIPINGARFTSLKNAALLEDGSVVAAGSAAFGSANLLNYSQLFRINADGQVVSNNGFSLPGSILQVTRDIVPFNNGLLASFESWPQTPAYYGKITLDLNLTTYWSGQAPHYDPLNPLDSIVKGPMTLRPIDNSSFVVGGVFKVGSPRYNGAVYVVDTTGVTSAAFIPYSQFNNDYAALDGCISPIDSSSFYFLFWENFPLSAENIPFEPTEPDVLHVYKLDNQLNILCDFVLDGFASNTYYVPIRIKTTPNGGFAIVGTKKDMSDPNSRFVGWAQTFSAADCNVGIPESSNPGQTLIFPNPGNAGFTVVLNGSSEPGTRITLYDMQGHVTANAVMNGATGHLVCTSLAPGLYYYRVTGHNGTLRASGKWVKQ